MTTVTSSIPLVNLKRQVASLKPEFEAAFAGLLERTDFVGGQAVDDFEAAFANFCQAKHAIGVGNGTDALYLIFRALELKPGDEVITTAMSFIATAEIFKPLGIKPVFADIDPQTYNLAPEKVAAAITPKTKAILPVHLYGQPADIEPLQSLAEQHGLILIEDAAQAHGAEYQGNRVGSLAKAAAFSFYPGKNLGAFGDGGAITTNDDVLAERVRMLANHGRQTKYEHTMEGVNSRLDTFQASILSIKLAHMDRWNSQRRERAQLYAELLADVSEIQLPQVMPDRASVFHLYVIQTAERDKLLDYLHGQGIYAGIHYPIPLHLQPAFQHLGYQKGDFPVSEKLGSECLSLPLFPEMTDDEVRTVCDAVHRFFNSTI